MRIVLLFLLQFGLSAWGNAWALSLSPVPVAPNVYAFIGDTGMRSVENEGMNANSGFVVTDEGVVVIDSGSTWQVAKEIHRAIRAVTRQPVKIVVNTGGQDHRWLGNGYFKSIGAEIIAARPALADMQARGAMQLDGLSQTLGEKAAGTQPVYPDRLFDQSETLRLGGQEIQLLYFHGGHTPGDSVVWLPKQGVLFSGDLVFVDRLLGVLPFSSATDWLASFNVMEKLGPKTIVPGHGQVCDLDRARRDTGDYLRLLITHMKQAVDKGIALQEAIDSLDQSAFSRLANFDLLKGGNASRVYLEMESQ
ncbi:MBL fold metallo-hydrolase [Sulfurimicrobium lacus]|uniref:MBL fold metallo-hydrolase n=1 Tax=Sulfurimicrobium lacus TaxID=2715678 RepID=A0A6F8VDL3_9PROT|nr:MBL fold metallo-hydrolase [Sulfurimicrobium lacus]